MELENMEKNRYKDNVILIVITFLVCAVFFASGLMFCQSDYFVKNLDIGLNGDVKNG